MKSFLAVEKLIQFEYSIEFEQVLEMVDEDSLDKQDNRNSEVDLQAYQNRRKLTLGEVK